MLRTCFEGQEGAQCSQGSLPTSSSYGWAGGPLSYAPQGRGKPCPQLGKGAGRTCIGQSLGPSLRPGHSVAAAGPGLTSAAGGVCEHGQKGRSVHRSPPADLVTLQVRWPLTKEGRARGTGKVFLPASPQGSMAEEVAQSAAAPGERGRMAWDPSLGRGVLGCSDRPCYTEGLFPRFVCSCLRPPTPPPRPHAAPRPHGERGPESSTGCPVPTDTCPPVTTRGCRALPWVARVSGIVLAPSRRAVSARERKSNTDALPPASGGRKSEHRVAASFWGLWEDCIPCLFQLGGPVSLSPWPFLNFKLAASPALLPPSLPPKDPPR